MKKELPIYNIQTFQNFENDFYANYLKQHIAEHHFTNLPHKHDFYLVMLFTHGTGKHEVDFVNYKVEPGALFIMKPGQMHHWQLSNDTNGYVFFHSKSFYNEAFTAASVQNFSFYNSNQNQPFIKLKGSSLSELKKLMLAITQEHKNTQALKHQKIHALINLVYVELTRLFEPLESINNRTYLATAEKFEDLIEKHYKTLKLAHNYAEKLNITEKHLNRICKACYNKTSTQLIANRIVLEAKRMLIHAKFNVTEIGEKLGYVDPSYFVRFFKKNAGVTPHAFLNRYK